MQEYLQECERRAAVVIQSFWRGFKERQRYNLRHRNTLRDMQKEQQAARTLQRVVQTHTHTQFLFYFKHIRGGDKNVDPNKAISPQTTLIGYQLCTISGASLPAEKTSPKGPAPSNFLDWSERFNRRPEDRAKETTGGIHLLPTCKSLL